MASSGDEQPEEHALTLPDALMRTTYEFLRQYDSGTLDEFRLAEGVVKLLRFAVLQSTDARGAVIDLCEHISKRVEDKCIVEALSATALDIVAVGDSEDFGTVQSRIDHLVSQMCALEGGMLESLTSCLTADADECSLIVLPEPHMAVVECAIDQAIAEGVTVDVTIVVPYEQLQSTAQAMADRLANMGVTSTIVHDADAQRAARHCDMAIVRAVGVHPEEDALCPHGSRLLSTAAWLQRVPLLLLAGTHTITADGSAALNAMGRALRHPGPTWAYEHCRDDRARHPVSVVAPAYDRVALQRVHTVLTERGCFAPDFLKVLAPRAGRVNDA